MSIPWGRFMSDKGISPGVAIGDAGAVGLIAVSIMGWLPPLAAIIAIIWYCIQIYESRTLQKNVRNWRLRKLVKLRSEATALELRLRENNNDLRGLDQANTVHLAATVASNLATHTQRLTDDALHQSEYAVAETAAAVIDATKRGVATTADHVKD